MTVCLGRIVVVVSLLKFYHTVDESTRSLNFVSLETKLVHLFSNRHQTV